MLSQTWVVSWPPYSMCALQQTSEWGVVSSETAAALLNKLDFVVNVVVVQFVSEPVQIFEPVQNILNW